MALTIGVSVYLYIKIPKDFSRSRTPAACRGRFWASRIFLTRRWCRKPCGSSNRSRGSRCGNGRHGCGHERQRKRRESGADLDATQADRRAQIDGGPGGCAVAAEDGGDARSNHVFAGQSGRSDRRPAVERAVSIHASVAGSEGAGAWGPKILEALRQLPQIADVSTDSRMRGFLRTWWWTAIPRPAWA